MRFLVEQRAMKNFLAVVVFCLPAFGQMASSGLGVDSGSVQVAAIPGGGPGPLGFADLPVNWVDNTACNPPGGTYDTEVVLGTTNNIGPNAAGEAIGQPYALTPAGLLDAANNWRDNADNASQTPHFADKWWRIKIPAGTVLHCCNRHWHPDLRLLGRKDARHFSWRRRVRA
jgi:hypothetical protein